MSIFKGSGVALVTPMKENEEINYDAMDALIEDQIAKGTDALIVCGTSGEAPTLDDPEHLEAIRLRSSAQKEECRSSRAQAPTIRHTRS